MKLTAGNRQALTFGAMLLAGAAAIYGAFAEVRSVRAQVASSTAPLVGLKECTALAGLRLGDAIVASAEFQPAGAAVPGVARSAGPGRSGTVNSGSSLPAFCRVIGSIRPEAGSDIRFEVWLPADGWSGRLMGAGNGGLAGSISYADLASIVNARMVGASTDTGHSGSPMDSSWAKGNPARVRDYGWRAMHLTTVAAKEFTRRFYGRGPDRSYFASCSNGGRMGLMEASRFPDDYDGILAGAPASPATKAAMTHLWLAQIQTPSGAAIRPDQVKLLQAEVLAQCDGIDGQADGLVADPRQCKFDAAKLTCGINSSAQCFTPMQLDTLQKIHDGPRDLAGRQIAYGFPATGAESGSPMVFNGWEGPIAKGRPGVPIQSAFPNAFVNLPATPIASDATFDFNRDAARVIAALSQDLDPQPDLRRYFARGGKLILWHGWADAMIPPQQSLDLHREILAHSGGRAASQTRLFMVPGVEHCFGGRGPALFGQSGAPLPSETADRNITAALIDWVEKRRSPQSLVGRLSAATTAGGPGPEKQRLICAYPARAELRFGMNPDKADSYTCRR